MPTSARHWAISASVTYRGETRDFGIFDTWSGGNATSDNTKHRRGAMGSQVTVGGPKTIEDVTITRDYDQVRDHQHAHWLFGCVGRARVVARKSVLDENGVAFGRPLVVSGVLVGYNHPEADSDSGDFAMFGLVVSPDGEVA